jgi:hypothetical protein
MSSLRPLGVVVGGLAAVLATIDKVAAVEDPPPQVVTLDELSCARRVGMIMVGETPSADLLAQVRAGTLTRDQLVERYLDDPRLLARLEAHALSTFGVVPTDVPLTYSAEEIREPARFFVHLYREDLDLAELVTADYGIGADGQPVARPGGAGILSNVFFLTMKNGGASPDDPRFVVGQPRRTAARVVAGKLLNLRFTAITEVPEGMETSRDAIKDNPVCASCHQDLYAGVDQIALRLECAAQELRGLAPSADCGDPSSILGVEVEDLEAMGEIMAVSNEFHLAMLSFFHQLLYGREPAVEDVADLRPVMTAYVAGGRTPRVLTRELMRLACTD